MKSVVALILMLLVTGVLELRAEENAIPDCWSNRAPEIKGLYELLPTMRDGAALMEIFELTSRSPYDSKKEKSYLRALSFPRHLGNGTSPNSDSKLYPKYIWSVQAHDWTRKNLIEEEKLRKAAEAQLKHMRSQVRAPNWLGIRCAKRPVYNALYLTHDEKRKPKTRPEHIDDTNPDVPESCWTDMSGAKKKKAVFRIWKRADRPLSDLSKFFRGFFGLSAPRSTVAILSFPFSSKEEFDRKTIRFSIRVDNYPGVRERFEKLVCEIELQIFCANDDMPDELVKF